MSLQTLRSDIDYCATTALTKYGILGVKVWISRGDLVNKGAARQGNEEAKKRAMEKVAPSRPAARSQAKPAAKKPASAPQK